MIQIPAGSGPNNKRSKEHRLKPYNQAYTNRDDVAQPHKHVMHHSIKHRDWVPRFTIQEVGLVKREARSEASVFRVQKRTSSTSVSAALQTRQTVLTRKKSRLIGALPKIGRIIDLVIETQAIEDTNGVPHKIKRQATCLQTKKLFV